MLDPNNKQEFTIDLKDLYTVKLDKAAINSEKGTTKLKAHLTTVAITSEEVQKRIHAAMGKINTDIDRMTASALATGHRVNTKTTRITPSPYKPGLPGIGQARTSLSPRINPVAFPPGSSLGAGFAGGILGGFVTNLVRDFASAIPDQMQKVNEAARKHEFFKSAFSNTLGSKSGASLLMQDTAKYAPNLGLTTDELNKKLIDFQTGNKKVFEDLGIMFDKHKGKMFATFQGERKEIDGSIQGMTNYIMNLAKSDKVVSETVKNSVALKNAQENLTQAWGERLQPTVAKASKALANWYGIVQRLVEIPLSEKIQDEATKIRALQIELNTANISEERRKKILDEIKEIEPELLSGIEKEKDMYGKLNGKIDEYLTKKREAIALAKVKESYADIMLKNESAKSTIQDSEAGIFALAAKYNLPIFDNKDVPLDQKAIALQQYLRKEGKFGYSSSPMGYGGSTDNAVAKDFIEVNTYLDNIAKSKATIQGLSKSVQKAKDAEANLYRILGGSPKTGGDTEIGGDTNLNSGLTSVSGGGSIKNITINLDSLIKGGVTIQTKVLSEGKDRAVDILKEGLLTVLNDANLAAN